MEQQESKGFVVALLLALTVVVYGGFLSASWRTRAQPVVPFAQSAGRPAAGAARASVADAVVPRSVAFTPGGAQTATWQRRERRSLEQVLNALGRQTPAFHRCDIGVMETDRAVATCNGVAAGGVRSRPATWTVEFRRTGGRWIMTRVAMR